jgi:hypothetical protein
MSPFGEQHILYYPATPDVNWFVVFPSRGHFGSHEDKCPASIMCSLKTLGFEAETEIDDFDELKLSNHDIFKFQVAVDDIDIMDILQRN